MAEMKKEAIICLGAGKSQVPVIKAAKTMGFGVLGVDRDAGAMGFPLCDEIINLSTHDADPIMGALKKIAGKYEIKGVLNRSSGEAVITTAVLTQLLSLPGVPIASARTLIDKSKLMSFCGENGIPSPKSIIKKDFKEINDDDIDFPVVVKPALSMVGKSGVSIAKERGELFKACLQAREFSVNGFVNIEEQVPGRDVTLMAVVQDGRLHPIVLLDEINVQDEKNAVLGFGFAVPSVFFRTPVYPKIIGLAQLLVNAFKLNNTPFNMSCRCNAENDPKLIEVHLDMGGDLILDALLPSSTSFDVLEYVSRMIVGQKPIPTDREFKSRAVIFGQGPGLVTDREFSILSAGNRNELEILILNQLKEKNEQGLFFRMQP